MTPTLLARTSTCPHDYCDLDHPDGGGLRDGAGTWWWVHAARFEFGAVWENVVTGALERRVAFDHDPTPGELRLAADWLELG